MESRSPETTRGEPVRVRDEGGRDDDVRRRGRAGEGGGPPTRRGPLDDDARRDRARSGKRRTSAPRSSARTGNSAGAARSSAVHARERDAAAARGRRGGASTARHGAGWGGATEAGGRREGRGERRGGECSGCTFLLSYTAALFYAERTKCRLRPHRRHVRDFSAPSCAVCCCQKRSVAFGLSQNPRHVSSSPLCVALEVLGSSRDGFLLVLEDAG